MGHGTSCKALIVPRAVSGKSSHTSDDNAAENKSNSERVPNNASTISYFVAYFIQIYKFNIFSAALLSLVWSFLARAALLYEQSLKCQIHFYRSRQLTLILHM